MDVDEDNPFELFISATNIRYCYYTETHKILGNTYGMCVLQVCPSPPHTPPLLFLTHYYNNIVHFMFFFF